MNRTDVVLQTPTVYVLPTKKFIAIGCLKELMYIPNRLLIFIWRAVILRN